MDLEQDVTGNYDQEEGGSSNNDPDPSSGDETSDPAEREQTPPTMRRHTRVNRKPPEKLTYNEKGAQATERVGKTYGVCLEPECRRLLQKISDQLNYLCELMS